MSWRNLENSVYKGPWTAFAKIGMLIVPMFLLVWYGGVKLFSYFNETAQVAQKEFGAKALLKKYEWFKDASAQLDKKMADIQVYEHRLKEPVSRDRLDREQRNLWLNELSGVKASYNSLAAEYNSQMAKINWAFANAGQLPPGASEPLPRSHKPYIGE